MLHNFLIYIFILQNEVFTHEKDNWCIIIANIQKINQPLIHNETQIQYRTYFLAGCFNLVVFG